MTSNSRGEQTGPRTENRSPWTRPGFLLAGGFAVLVVVLLVAVLVLTSGDEPEAGPQPPAAPAPSGEAPSASSPRDVGPTTVPTSPPENVRWQLYHTVALPFSEQAGPYEAGRSTATGYAHTPTGALLAAAQIPIRKLVAPDWRSVVEQQIVAGPGREAFTQARAEVSGAEVTPGQFGQYAGFKFVNYTPDTATIQFVTRFVSGQMQATTITVQWSQGDWKLVLQPDGGDSPTAQPVSDLTGYVAWGGM